MKKLKTILFILLLTFSLSIYAQQAPLFTAVRENKLNAVRELLEKGADPNACDDDSDNVLINAALYASVDCMKLLLDKKADPNRRNLFGQTPIMLCTHELDKMKLLVQYGADINAVAQSGNTALLIACSEYGLYENIKWLLDNGADATVKRWNTETVLMRAVQFADTMTINLLLRKAGEFDVNTKPWGFTMLYTAIRMANWPVVLFLLDKGADPDIADPLNMLPIGWAAEMNNLEIVNALLKKSKNINKVDSNAIMSPLMLAVYSEYDNPKIIKALLDHGAPVNFRAKNGTTALSWAMKKGNTGAVALLKRAGAK